jgi:hypothetical protein
MSDYPKHDKALTYAKHCLGVHESPPASNRGPVQVSNPFGGVDFFNQHDFVAGVGYPWCASFWLTCWAEAGHPFPYRSPSAHALGDWAKKNGWAKQISDLVPGDGCDWNEGAGHISMFESYDANTGTVHTIDGNWGDQVRRTTHRVGALRVAIHVPEKKITVLAPKPYWVIATSVNGHRKILFSQYARQKKILGLLPRMLTRWGKYGITIKRRKRK